MLKKLEKAIWRPTFALPKPITDEDGLQESLSSYLYRFKREFVNELNLIIEELRLCYPKLHKKDFVSCMLDLTEVPLTYSGSGLSSQYIAKVLNKMVVDHDWSDHFLQRFNITEQFSQPLKLKKKAGWCKHCLAEWQAEDKPMHWPLAWLTVGYEKCHIHNENLSYYCEHCGEAKTEFYSELPLNHCSYCNSCLSSSGFANPLAQLEFWKELRNEVVLNRLSKNTS
jgi:hypothetical protein